MNQSKILSKICSGLLAVLFVFISAPDLKAEGEGIALVKRRDSEGPEFWKPFFYLKSETFAVVVKLTPYSGKDPVSVPRSQVGALVELPDLKNGTFENEAAFNAVTATRKQLEDLAKKCRDSAAALTAKAEEIKKAEEKFATGNILKNGKWIDMVALKKEQKAKEPPVITLPSITIDGLVFKTVQLTSFSGTTFGISHAEGTRNFLTSVLNDDQIRQLNTTSTFIRITK